MKQRSLSEIKWTVFDRASMPKFLTAKEASKFVYLTAERLTELADSGLTPCVRIDVGPPLFIKRDLVAWVKANLVQLQEGRALQVVPVAVAEAPIAPFHDLPDSLRPMFDRMIRFADLEGPPCVYFLVRQREVVYVGQTLNLPARVNAHKLEKDFDRIFYLPVPRSELDEVEGTFIRTLRPPLNGCAGPRPANAEATLKRLHSSEITTESIPLELGDA